MDWDTGKLERKKKCRLMRVSSRELMEVKRLCSEEVISKFYLKQSVLSAERGYDLGE